MAAVLKPLFRGIEKMNVVLLIMLMVAAVGAVMTVAILAALKILEEIVKAVIRRRKGNKKRK